MLDILSKAFSLLMPYFLFTNFGGSIHHKTKRDDLHCYNHDGPPHNEPDHGLGYSCLAYNRLAADGQYELAQHDQAQDVKHASSKYITATTLQDHDGCMREPVHHIGDLGLHPEDATPGVDLAPVRQPFRVGSMDCSSNY